MLSKAASCLGGLGPLPAPLHLVMDRAYADNETLQLALDFGFLPVVPPKSNRLHPWQYDKSHVSPAQRNRATVPATERLPSHLLAL
jgi:hypothetical protein